jgi:hypothetical protein
MTDYHWEHTDNHHNESWYTRYMEREHAINNAIQYVWEGHGLQSANLNIFKNGHILVATIRGIARFTTPNEPQKCDGVIEVTRYDTPRRQIQIIRASYAPLPPNNEPQ